jgi:5-hydroxyisourate hydrolase-like protein (transthyretin family)
MKRIYFIVLLALFSYSVFGQQQLTGKVSGRVFEKSTTTPFIDATVAVYSKSDSSLISGVATDKDGEPQTLLCL